MRMGRWCSLATRPPVTGKIAGSNPVRPASEVWFIIFSKKRAEKVKVHSPARYVVPHSVNLF
jgi:hypothetical protein